MDFSNPTAIARALIPKIPFMFTTALYHSLSLSPTSSTWDLKTELVISLIRTFLSPPHPRPLLIQQAASLKDPGIKNSAFVSKTNLPPPPEPDLLNLLTTAIDSLKTSPTDFYTLPSYAPISAEWIAHKPAPTPHDPSLPESTHYTNLTASLPPSHATILYLHGGAFYLMDPSSHRLPTTRLARLSSSRCFSLRYRLSPQHPFPSALLDALTAYLSLLHPPPSSFHAPIPPTKIILAGDSAGGNLALALLQLLLHINRTALPNQTLTFHSTTIPLPLPLPAAAAVSSPWLDLTRSLPSLHTNARFDYLPPPVTPAQIARFPSDAIWPAQPPRGDIYCDTSLLCHPLVSPLAATDWRGACPLWIGVGEEMLRDEAACVASWVARQGGEVWWGEWGGMCHCFAMVLVWSEGARVFFEEWAGFVKRVGKVEREEVGKGKRGTSGRFFEVGTLREREVDVVGGLAVKGEEEARGGMEACREARMEGWERKGSKL